jgi:hypothetical protein
VAAGGDGGAGPAGAAVDEIRPRVIAMEKMAGELERRALDRQGLADVDAILDESMLALGTNAGTRQRLTIPLAGPDAV